MSVLREAAEKMRERCYGATSGPWQVGSTGDDPSAQTVVYSAEILTRYPDVDPAICHVVPGSQVQGMPDGYGLHSNAEHVASWSPEIADLVAAVLVAADSNYDPEFPDDAESWDFYQASLALAHAYLGRQS